MHRVGAGGSKGTGRQMACRWVGKAARGLGLAAQCKRWDDCA